MTFRFMLKELKHLVKTNKLLVLFVVFVILGIQSPIIAKFMPKIIKLAIPNNLQIKLPKVTKVDIWVQYLKNTFQMGLFIITLVFSNSLVKEIKEKTLINLITKGVNRKIIIKAKYYTSWLIWSILYFFSFGITMLYSLLFWKYPYIENLIYVILLTWLFGIFILSVINFLQVVFSSNIIVLILTALLILILLILSIFSITSKYNPLSLVNINVTNGIKIKELIKLWPALIITVVPNVVLPIFSILIFNKKQI